MTAMEETPKKKTAKKKGFAAVADDVAADATAAVVADYLEGDMTPEEAVASFAEARSKVVKRAKPGTADYDWQAEYPGEECYVYTSSEGLTIGLTKLNPTNRKPKPGKLRRLHREGGLSVMWYFIELVSSPESLVLQEELEEEDYTAMLRGWADFAGIELSE
jgi:hypothetical protein